MRTKADVRLGRAINRPAASFRARPAWCWAQTSHRLMRALIRNQIASDGANATMPSGLDDIYLFEMAIRPTL
jgi:hypothetical protein